jgi:hypothetical protein
LRHTDRDSIKKNLGLAAGPIVAQVQASGGNLNGQIKFMSMRETIDGNAIT